MSASGYIDDYLNDALSGIIRDRRALHRWPETADTETRTQQYLWDALSKLNPDKLEKMAHTGIRCVFMALQPLAPGEKRRTIGFRADIDALNVNETTGLEFKSERPGYMHACGHDGHMATMLAVARYCAARRDALLDNVTIVFQPAEEATGGAKRLIEEGALDDPHVDEIYGMHVMPTLKDGEIACPDGPLMASVHDFDITVTGEAAHGAMPHMGRDALAAAIALYNQLQTIFTRQTDAFNQKVLTVGAMRAGERRNVVADRAVMQCTLRTFDENVDKQCVELVRQHMRSIEIGYGVKCELTDYDSYLPVINDPYAAGRVRSAAGEMAVSCHPLNIAEDFSFYQRKTRGAFFFCGIARDGKYDKSLHSSDFDLDERSLLNGLRVFISLIATR